MFVYKIIVNDGYAISEYLTRVKQKFDNSAQNLVTQVALTQLCRVDAAFVISADKELFETKSQNHKGDEKVRPKRNLFASNGNQFQKTEGAFFNREVPRDVITERRKTFPLRASHH